MTVTVPITSNSPEEYNLAQLQVRVNALTAEVAAFASGSPAQNDAIQKLASTQREFVDALMNHMKLMPATIIAQCAFTLNTNSNQPADFQINAALNALNTNIAQTNATTAGHRFAII